MRKLLTNSLIAFILLTIIFLVFSLKNNAASQELLRDAEMNRKAFQHTITNHGYRILIDFNKPIFMKRLWLLDNHNKVVLHCHVSHAWRSGFVYANKLSNTPQSNLSSAGAFVAIVVLRWMFCQH